MSKRITHKKIKTIGTIGLLSANLLSQPLNSYVLAEAVSSEQTATNTEDATSSQIFEFADENGTIQAIATVTYLNRVKVGTIATVKIHVDWTNEDPDDVGVCVFQGTALQLSGAKYTGLKGITKGKYALTEDVKAAFIYDNGAVSGGKDITLQVQPSEAGEITINGGLNYSQIDPKVSSNVQPITISMTAYAEDNTSLVTEDSTVYAGDSWDAASNFVSATDKDGNAIDFSAITVTGSVDTSTPGDYTITYTYGGHSSEATVHVVANDSNNDPDSSSNKTSNSSQDVDQISKKLPTTGEQNIVTTSVLGIGLLLSALGGLFFKKKKNNSK